MSGYAWVAVAFIVSMLGTLALIGWSLWLERPQPPKVVGCPGCGGRHCSGEDA